jgi:hypothetical protein
MSFLDHTRTLYTREVSSGGVNGPTQRPLPENTQYSQQTDSVPLVGFEPASERQYIHALDRAVNEIGFNDLYFSPNVIRVIKSQTMK